MEQKNGIHISYTDNGDKMFEYEIKDDKEDGEERFHIGSGENFTPYVLRLSYKDGVYMGRLEDEICP